MNIIENAKEIASLIKTLGDIDLYKKILNLEIEIMNLTKENRELEEVARELQRSQIVISELKFVSPFYQSSVATEIFCARCIESDQIAIHVTKTGETKSRRRYWDCPQCKSRFLDFRNG